MAWILKYVFQVDEAFAKFDASGDNNLDYKVPDNHHHPCHHPPPHHHHHHHHHHHYQLNDNNRQSRHHHYTILITTVTTTLSGILPNDPQETRGEVKKQLIIKILTINMMMMVMA